MKNNDMNNNLICDSGMIENVKTKQARLFVTLCNIVSIGLIILGIVAFVKGTF